MSRKFKCDSFNTYGKSIRIYGPVTMELQVDWDDVDHTTVKREVRKLLHILNGYWDKVQVRRKKPVKRSYQTLPTNDEIRSQIGDYSGPIGNTD